MLGNESLLIAFADSAAIDPASVARARRALAANWTKTYWIKTCREHKLLP
jgi:hypothetical protein